MTEESVSTPHPIEILHARGIALACGKDGQLRADKIHGLFAGDTRLLSTYQIVAGGRTWELISRERRGYASARWSFQNPELMQLKGAVPPGMLLLTLDRHLAGAMHDDILVESFSGEPVRLRLDLLLDADFSDIFSVKEQSMPPHLNVTHVLRGSCLELGYRHADFHRGLRVKLTPSRGQCQLVGSLIVFDLELTAETPWSCCIEMQPMLDGGPVTFFGDPHLREAEVQASHLHVEATPVLARPFERGLKDLRSLAVPEDGRAYVAAGVPWFLTLFGRDSLTVSLMSSLSGTWAAEGALHSLAKRQAAKRDDWRDEEPGKFPHEIRLGELAHFDWIPHSAYYGSHDAPALYCLALWNAWRWSGKRELLTDYLPAARRAMQWCETLGDRDGDGLLEYATRSSEGYYNQSWKDAPDAIVGADGKVASLPLATVEMQGYFYAARLALAELLRETGEGGEADRLTREAAALRRLVEERYWCEERGFYAQSLDGSKRRVESISSNPGHLLWCGLVTPERAALVGRRVLAPDMYTGWGLRTLSSENPAYNPLSYQCGSVWPHDTALCAAGLRRYGRYVEADELLLSVLQAANAFEANRLPELFCGLPRHRGLPVAYEKANVPQAWAAAAPVLAVQVILGLVPDAPRQRCYIEPRLPDWLPELTVTGIPLGGRQLSLKLIRSGERTEVEVLAAEGIEVLRGSSEAALWGKPLA